MKKTERKQLFKLLVSITLLLSITLTSCDVLQMYIPTAVPSATAVVQLTKTPAPSSTPTLEPTATPTQAFYLNVLPSDLRGTQIRFWHPWQGTLATQTASRIVEFNNSNPWGITVTFYEPGGTANLIESVEASLLDATWPNVVIAPSATLANWQGEYKNLTNINDYIAMSENGLTPEQIADFNPVIWEQDVIDDRRFGYPIQRDAYVLVYNKSWANEIGYETLPETPAQFQNQVCAAGKVNLSDEDTANNGTGGWIVNNQNPVLLSWLISFEYNGLEELRANNYKFLDSTSVRAYRYLRYLFDSECSWNARVSPPYDYFANRQTIAFSAAISELPDIDFAVKYGGSTDDWLVLPYPESEKNQVMFTEGQSFAIFAATPQEQMASWLFMRWMNSAEYQAEIVEASSTLPISTSAMEALKGYQVQNLHWTQSLQYMDKLVAMPNGANWLEARSVLSDSGWQLYQQAEVENSTLAVTEIFSQVDQMISELMDKEE
jgi:multiple sugar transport system substrate-binding protein